MGTNNIYPLLQSAYRKQHNTETALLKVMNDILLKMNSQHVTLLVMLDLSTAFDTVNPLSPSSDQHQFPPNNFDTQSRGKVMRINKMIT